MSLKSETIRLSKNGFNFEKPYGNAKTASQTTLKFYNPPMRFRQINNLYYATASTEKPLQIAEESILSKIQTIEKRQKFGRSVSRLSELLNSTAEESTGTYIMTKRAKSLSITNYKSQQTEDAFNKNFALQKSWVASLIQSKQQFGLQKKKSPQKFTNKSVAKKVEIKTELVTKRESLVPELIRKLIFVPISALDLTQQVQNQETLFIQAVQQQEKKNFKKAIRYYHYAIHNRKIEKTDQTGIVKTDINSDGEFQDSDFSEQDLEGYDSDIQSKQLPRQFLDGVMSVVQTKKNQASFKHLNMEEIKSSTRKQLEIINFCFINLSICLLKAGYLKKGLEQLDKVNLTRLKVVQIYNASVMRLAEQNVIQATKNLSFVTDFLTEPVPAWIDPVLLKSNIHSLLIIISKMSADPSKLLQKSEFVIQSEEVCVDREMLFIPGFESHLKQNVSEVGTAVITIDQQKLEASLRAGNIFTVVQKLVRKLTLTNIMRFQSNEKVNSGQMQQALDDIKVGQQMKCLKLARMKRQCDSVLKNQKKEQPSIFKEPLTFRSESENKLTRVVAGIENHKLIKEVSQIGVSEYLKEEVESLKDAVQLTMEQQHFKKMSKQNKNVKSISSSTLSNNSKQSSSQSEKSKKSHTSSERDKINEQKNDQQIDGRIYAKNLQRNDNKDKAAAMSINTLYFSVLVHKIENLAKHVQKQQLDQIRSLVTRMLQIRETYGYDQIFAKFKKSIAQIKSIHLEDAKDLIADFLLVLEEKKSKQFEVSFIRDEEMMEIAEAKKIIDRREFFNFQHIYSLLKRFPILQKVPSTVCQKILEKSDLQIYQPGQKLFKQKDDTPDFFILVKGVVSISLSQGQYPGVTQIVKTYFDGASIGEMAYFDSQVELLDQNLIKSLSQQRFSAEAVEKSWVLKVNKKVWSQQTSSAQNDFSKILVFLQSCSLFEGISLPILIPLAQNLEFARFKLGQPIIDRGVEPKGIFFIFKGHCRVGINQKSNQKKVQSKFCWYRQKYQAMITKHTNDPAREGKTANITFTNEQKMLNAERDRKLNSINSKKIKSVSGKFRDKIFMDRLVNFDDQGTQVAKGTVIECKFRNIFSLTERDYFGGRQMVRDQEINNHQDGGHHSNSQGTNMFVVADSAEVELLYMDQGLLRLFPSEIQIGILDRLKRSKFIMNPLQSQTFLDGELQNFSAWDNKKKEMIEQFVKDNYTNRNGIQPR